MKDSEIIALAYKCGAFHALSGLVMTEQQLQAFSKAIADPLQYKIDQLMLEFCPEKMSEDQKSEWAEHQVIFKGDDRIC